MSIYQISYAVLLVAAVWWGRPDWRLVTLCALNFVGTMILSASPVAVGVLDMSTIALLVLIGSGRALALASIFAVLVPIYVIGDYLSWSEYAIYTVVDILGIAILGVLAGGSGGRGIFSHHNRRNSVRSAVVSRHYATCDMGEDTQVHSWIVKGKQ